jgi:hypothetical protein
MPENSMVSLCVPTFNTLPLSTDLALRNIADPCGIDLLLDHEPNNLQAQSLRTLIEQAVTRDGYIGML